MPYTTVYDGKVLVVEAIEKEASSSAARTEEKTSAVDYPSASEISVKELLGLVNRNYQKYIPEPSVKRSSRVSAEDIKAIQRIGRKSVNQFASAEIAKTEGFARRYWQNMGVKFPFFRSWFGDWRKHDASKVQMIKQSQGTTISSGKAVNAGTDMLISWSRSQLIGETHSHNRGDIQGNKKTELPRRNLLQVKPLLILRVLLGAIKAYHSRTELSRNQAGKAKSVNSLLMHTMYAVADMGNSPTLIKLFVEEMNAPNSMDTAKRAYQLRNIESQQLSAKGSGKSLAQSISTADIKTVADLFAAVKTKDADFSPNAVHPLLLNEDGTPKVAYHATFSEFTRFDKSF